MTIEEMIDSDRATGSSLIEWAVQDSDTLQIDWDGVMRDVPKTIMKTQDIAPAAEHREQAKAILTQLEIEPPDLQNQAYFEDTEKKLKGVNVRCS